MTKYTPFTLALLILLPLASPAAAQNREHLQMAAELRMLQEQNQQLSLALQQTMEALKSVNGRIDAAMEAMRKGFADQDLATKNMARDVNTIAERARDTDTRMRTLGDEITALQATMTAVAAAIAQGAGVGATPVVDPNAPAAAAGTPAVGAGPAPVPPPVVGSTVGLSPARMLEQGKGDYYASQYSTAITSFEQLIKTFPSTEAAAEAQYWIGESYFNLNQWAEAIAAYNTVLQKYPRSRDAAQSAYKRGVAQRRMGDVAAARASFEQCIKQFPDSDAARLAQQQLDGLPKPAATGTAPTRP
jgi:tol-pal system protein YbgF